MEKMEEAQTDRMFAFEDLLVWQKSIAFAETAIKTIDLFEAPRKHFRIIEQLESAAISVSANIAEGKGRYSKKEFIHYLYISRGSLFETISLLILICRLRWIEKNTLSKLKSSGEEIANKRHASAKNIY